MAVGRHLLPEFMPDCCWLKNYDAETHDIEEVAHLVCPEPASIAKEMTSKLEGELSKFIFNPLVYEQDELSRIFWQRYAIANTEATNTVLDDPIKDWDTLTLEVFQRLYNDPHPPRLEPILPEHKWATVLHQHFQDQPDFTILTQKCFNDVAASGVATTTIANHLKHHIPKPESP